MSESAPAFCRNRWLLSREDVVFVPLDGRKLNANLYATYRRDDCLPALDLFLGVLRDATLAWRREKFGA